MYGEAQADQRFFTIGYNGYTHKHLHGTGQ